MEKEAQKPQIAPPRIRNIDEVLRELRVGPGMPNQAHLPTYKVSLTEKEYTPSEAMEKVKNIATLMDMMMDEDFLERCLNARIDYFYINPKDIPQELIDSLASLGPSDNTFPFRIDREKGMLKPISKSRYDRLNPNERGRLHRSVLGVIREGRLLCISFSGAGWWVNYPAYNEGVGPRPVAFTEPTD